jgi:hypothetical protein
MMEAHDSSRVERVEAVCVDNSDICMVHIRGAIRRTHSSCIMADMHVSQDNVLTHAATRPPRHVVPYPLILQTAGSKCRTGVNSSEGFQ